MVYFFLKSYFASASMRIFPLILAVLALLFLIGGAKLIAVGGSSAYAVSGLALAISAVLLWRGNWWGAWVYAALLASTFVWALAEAGLDAWALLPRLWILTLLGIWLLRPGATRKLHRGRPFPQGMRAATAILVPICVVAVLAILHTVPVPGAMLSPDTSGEMPSGTPARPAGDGDWTETGGNHGGTRFSDLGQITPANVAGLQVAWTYHFGEADPNGMEMAPVKVGDAVYVCSGANVVAALDAETGAQRWRYDPKPRYPGPCRGVAYDHNPTASGPCADRIFTNTFDARLIALDAHSGLPCAGFGNGGEIDLREGMRPVGPAQYFESSAPILVRGRVVVGGVALAIKGFDEPSGVIRAFDAVTGKLSWAYDAGHPDRAGAPPAGEFYTVGMPNAWAPMVFDNALGLVFVPTATGGAAYYGAKRRPVDDEISTSVMALDADTGRRRWITQLVHHDVWDYDVASQPLLVDLRMAGGVVHALVQPTKMGETFVLDRATGTPIDPIVERATPQAGAVPEERLSATQPFPTNMPSLAGGTLTEATMWGLTPFDQMWCRIRFRQARYQGIMTAPGLTPNIEYPGWLGGMDWGGGSVDPQRGVMVAVTSYVANYVRMTPLDGSGAAVEAKRVDRNDLAAFALQADVPYANSTLPFLSPIGVPCQQPPWSRLTAIDLPHHRVLWSRPLGTGKDTGPFGLRAMVPVPIGVPALGGSVLTATGLTFVAASIDRTFRAFETASGRLLWQAALPASGNSTPITYQAPSGRQMILLAAGGHKILGKIRSDAVIAYALPKAGS